MVKQRAIEGMKGEVIRSKDTLFRKFDSFYDKKEGDFIVTKDYLRELKEHHIKVKKLIQQLNKKIVVDGRKISNLEYSYRLKEKEEQKLRRLYKEIPIKLRALGAERKGEVKEMDKLLKVDQLASRNLDKAAHVLESLEAGVKSNEQKVAELKREVAQLTKKKKLLDSVDWNEDELYEQRTEMSMFLRRETAERKRQEKAYKKERAGMDRLMNKTLKKEIVKLLEE